MYNKQTGERGTVVEIDGVKLLEVGGKFLPLDQLNENWVVGVGIVDRMEELIDDIENGVDHSIMLVVTMENGLEMISHENSNVDIIRIVSYLLKDLIESDDIKTRLAITMVIAEILGGELDD